MGQVLQPQEKTLYLASPVNVGRTDDSEILSVADSEEKNIVGKGAFGFVTRGHWKGKEAAFKSITNAQIGQAEFKIVSELNRVGCQNIIQFLECYEEEMDGVVFTVIVSDLYDGTLYDFRNNHT